MLVFGVFWFRSVGLSRSKLGWMVSVGVPSRNSGYCWGQKVRSDCTEMCVQTLSSH